MTENSLSDAENFLLERIPLTHAMGVRLVPDAIHGFAVEAPVLLNKNHLSTAFGGSINSIATLAGYALLWLELRDEIAHIVIGSSSIRFLRPIRQTIRAICARPKQSEFADFRTTLNEQGKARMRLSVQVEEEGVRAAQFHATFIAFRDAG